MRGQYLGRNRFLHAAEFLDGRVPVVSWGGEDDDHQLEFRRYLGPDGLEVCVCSIISHFNQPGILNLPLPVSFQYTRVHIPHTSIPMGGATRFIILMNSTAFDLSLFVTTTTQRLMGTWGVCV